MVALLCKSVISGAASAELSVMFLFAAAVMDHESKRRKVDELLDAASTRLDPEDSELLSSETVRNALAARDLYRFKAIQRLTFEQVVNAGFTEGVAGALKTAFPDAALSCKCWCMCAVLRRVIKVRRKPELALAASALAALQLQVSQGGTESGAAAAAETGGLKINIDDDSRTRGFGDNVMCISTGSDSSPDSERRSKRRRQGSGVAYLIDGTQEHAVVEDDAISAFLRILLDPQRDLDQPQVLQMPGTITVPDFKALGTAGLSGILIRECWPAFRDCVLEDEYANIVAGTPGVGKSWFAWWFMACLLRGTKGRAPLPFVVYQRRANQSFLLQRDGCVFRGSAVAFESHVTELGPDAWLIFDGLQPEDLVKHHVLVISSPRPSVYKDLVDGGAHTRFMPIWTWEEIQLCWQALYPLAQFPMMTEERVQKLYSWYRGVPRRVLTIPSRQARAEVDEQAFNGVVTQARKKPSEVLTMVTFTGIPEQYHKVLYIEPADEQFEMIRLVFACRKVTQLLLEEVKKAGEQILTQAFNVLQKNPGQAAFCGQVFEVLMMNTLAAGHDVSVSSSTIAALLNTETGRLGDYTSVRGNELTVKAGRLVGVQYTISTFDQSLKDCWQQEGVWGSRTLLVPDGANFPEIDAVLLPAPPAAGGAGDQACVNEIELFQFTVSRNNKVLNRTKLGRVLAALPAAKQYTLYYMVPSTEQETFRLKSITRETVVGEAQSRLDRVKLVVISPSTPFEAWAVTEA
ncbi:hypothetical protein JKP88DRAFT_267525 [Tribonema minus]|uniref:Uncharacterized protein n=1 Tax=Tribonema minus TaxID=303371 RepID=A0A836CJB7_9STRA|nr:hypothetical protein JKP88DRAFT_267525 [Tribonema minus]